MKKQFCPIIVQRNGKHIYAKAISDQAKKLGEKYCWTLEEAQNIIEEVTYKLNKKSPHLMTCGGFGITSEHSEENEAIDSYIKVREVSEWKIIK